MADILQNLTDYEPTEKEKCLLDILLEPANRMKSVTEICKIAKCARMTYYEAFGKPGFVEYYKQQSLSLVKQNSASILNTFIREAQRGSFQHGKILLEMAGIYTENKRVEGKIEAVHSGTVNVNNVGMDLSKLSDEELNKLEDIFSKLQPTNQD